MKPVNICVSPGTEITFKDQCHNVINVSAKNFYNCIVHHHHHHHHHHNHHHHHQCPYKFKIRKTGKSFFASRRKDLCEKGMRAKVVVDDDCPCRSVKDAQQQRILFLKKVHQNIGTLLHYSGQYRQNETFHQTLEKLYRIDYIIFTPDQQKVLLKSK